MRTSYMEVSLSKFNNNIKRIKKYIKNKEIMPIIKANAYGTYINKKLDIINKFTIVGCALTEEGINLRKEGYKKEIFILNPPYIDEIKDIVKYDLTFGLSEEKTLSYIIKNKLQAKVHLEIETGMNRTGINLKDLDKFLEKIKENKNIKVEGVYSHLSSADYDKEYTRKQIDIFKEALEKVKRYFSVKYIHLEASNGLINLNENITNLVRPGIIIYGYKSFDGIEKKIKLEEVCKLKSKVTFLKEVKENESIGYSRSFKTKKKMKIATIPIGYADGIKRSLGNIGSVVINNKRAKIVGNVCMDSIMVDVTDIKHVKVGSDVYIWDNNKITIEEIAKLANTINYEIISTISERIPRIFTK